MTSRPGPLHLGETIDPATHARSGTPVTLPPSALTTHGVIVGQTGSGKTGLGIALIEEVLLSGVPTILIDPKGDLTNLALTFPDLSAQSFAPWVEAGDPAVVAKQWSDGLASWAITGADITTLRNAAEAIIWTPGSTAGRPLNLVASLKAPANVANAEARADEVNGTVSALLGLVGIESDPLSGREHILLANLVERSWSTGTDLTLESLLGQVQDPPVRKLGVLELDTFYPAKDRKELVLKLNGLLASPSFASWSAGDPLDITALLHDPVSGKPRASIISIAHLSDEERQFAVTRILGALITWMRSQPGTGDLRVLLYIDEVLGYVPPTSNPPTKGPLLTLVKQGRAFGVGVVLATQNPVDVDYKVLSNATTWMVGRLQTERDRDRLLEGMRSASGGVDIDMLSATISGLAKREFVMQRAGADKPSVFTSRWAMSYLRGPLTREQIAIIQPPVAPAPTATAAPTTAAPITAAPTTAAPRTALPSDALPSARAMGDTETPVAPKAVGGVNVGWVDPAAVWLNDVGGVANGTKFEAAIAVRLQLTFDDEKAAIRESHEWEAIVHPLSSPLDPAAAVQVDHDDRDFRTEAPAGATYTLVDAAIDTASWWKTAEKRITDHVVTTQTLDVHRNDALNLWGRPGESLDDFAKRCDTEAGMRADQEGEKLRSSLTAKIDRVNAAMAEAERKKEEAKADTKSHRTNELIAGAGELLGALLGGRRSVRSIGRAVRTVSDRHASASRSAAKVGSAEERVAEKMDELHGLETQLADELFAIDAKWSEQAKAVSSVHIPLERSDLRVVDMKLVWLPVG